jgi:ketosteroid isomerase-like protein
MYRIATVSLIAALAAGPVAASDQTDIMAVVHQWVDGFNKGDMNAAAAACTDQGAIIDDIPPNVWHGAAVCSQWAKDFEAWAAKNGIAEPSSTPGKPRHFTVNGAQAYMVLPVTFKYKDHGKPMQQTGSLAIISFAKGASGWRISGWAWADGVTAAASADAAH